MNGDIGRQYLNSYLLQSDIYFKKYLDKKIREARQIGSLPAELLEAFSYLTRKGKKIRGSLVVLGYKAAGGKEIKKITDTSLFIELIHSGLLVHDDIQDRDEFRRGMPTIHKQYKDKAQCAKLGDDSYHYGISMGLNAGITAYFLGYEKLLSADFPNNRLVKSANITSEYISRVSYGQALDVSNVFINNVDQDELLNILKYKSAEYTGVLPLLVGATLAGKENQDYLNNLVKYGLCLGWAFQIQDDVLGAFGDEEKLGKPVGSDFREGKVTLLMLYLKKHGNKKHRKIQREILGNKNITQSDVVKMQQVLKESGAYDHVVRLGWKYVKDGEKLIPNITKEKNLQEVFHSLLYFMMERAV